MAEINRDIFLQNKASPKKCRARKAKAPLDVTFLRRSKLLIKKDGFKDGAHEEDDDQQEYQEDVPHQDEPNLPLALVPAANMICDDAPTPSATTPYLPLDVVQSLATSFLNMPALAVTKEVLEADDAHPNV